MVLLISVSLLLISGTATAQPRVTSKALGNESLSIFGRDATSATTTDLTKDSVERLELTGWYPSCNDDFECQNPYNSISTPKQLDASGATCYVNPVKEPRDAVLWYATVPAYSNTSRADYIYAYLVVLSLEGAEDNMPTDCADDGSCICGPFEQVGEGWDDPEENVTDALHWCKAPASVCSISQVDLAPGRDCNANLRVTSRLDNGDLISSTCILTATLEEIPSESTSGGALTTGSFMNVLFGIVAGFLTTVLVFTLSIY